MGTQSICAECIKALRDLAMICAEDRPQAVAMLLGAARSLIDDKATA